MPCQQLPRQATNTSESTEIKLCSSTITGTESKGEGQQYFNHSVYASTNTYATKYWMIMLAFGLSTSIPSHTGITDGPIIYLRGII